MLLRDRLVTPCPVEEDRQVFTINVILTDYRRQPAGRHFIRRERVLCWHKASSEFEDPIRLQGSHMTHACTTSDWGDGDENVCSRRD